MVFSGLGSAEITPRGKVPLFGYGDRTHDCTGVHDPLQATAWWLQEPGGQAWAWVTLDLCVLSIAAAAHLAREAARRAGFAELAPERILVSTTHTHSGPDTWELHRDTRPWARRYRGLLERRVAEALVGARRRARPCRIEVREARGGLGVNRRDPAGPVDPRILLLSLVDEAGGLRGLLFHYSCHLTVLGVDNYRLSADWLGPVRRELQRELAVPVGFLPGAEGDVDPVSRGFLDMADPDQARGASFAALEELASGVTAALRAALAREAGPPRAVLESLRAQAWAQALPLRYGALGPEAVRERVGAWKRELGDFLGLEPAALPEGLSVGALVKQRCRALGLGPEEVRRRVAAQFAYANFVTTYGQDREAVDPRLGRALLPCHLVDFGPVSLLCAPVEILVEAALDWQRRHPERVALLCGLTQGWLGYLPHASNFAETEAEERYETVSTVFAPEACELLLAEADRRLGRAPGGRAPRARRASAAAAPPPRRPP